MDFEELKTMVDLSNSEDTTEFNKFVIENIDSIKGGSLSMLISRINVIKIGEDHEFNSIVFNHLEKVGTDDMDFRTAMRAEMFMEQYRNKNKQPE